MRRDPLPVLSQTDGHPVPDALHIDAMGQNLQPALDDPTGQALRAVLWASRSGFWQWHRQGSSLLVRGLKVAGSAWRDRRWSLAALLRIMVPADRKTVLQAWRQLLAGTHSSLDVCFRVQWQGQLHWLQARGRTTALDHLGRAERVTGTLKGVTGCLAEEDLLRTMAQAFATTQDAMVVVGADWQIVDANQALATLVGRTLSELHGAHLLDWLQLPTPQAPAPRLETTLQVAGGAIPVDATLTKVEGGSRRWIIALRDMRERHEVEARLQRLALQDALTELPNRTAVEQRLAHCVVHWRERGFGLLFLDLDGFKGVNDSFGHRAGDGLLREVSERLRATLPAATIGRWGGDEFVILLPEGSTEIDIRDAAQQLLATMAMPFHLGTEHQMVISPSIGAVACPRDGTDAATLLRKADVAMYAAKDRGRNGLALFEPSIEANTTRRVRLLSLMRLDAERGAFHFVAQPKVDREGRPTGAELLMRWQTREFGEVSPVEFIPLAEQSGAIDLMGRHALHRAAQLAAQVAPLGAKVTVAVNLSPRQLLSGGLERMALRACEAHGVAPEQLELELTESALASGVEVVQPLLQRLRERGFSLALDDFGTGYSSLSHLLHMPFHKVKIDRAFVKNLLHNHRACEVIKGTLQICKGLGMTSVAEGVETTEQFELLRTLGVDEFQGYLFARPMAIDDWLAQLRERPRVLSFST